MELWIMSVVYFAAFVQVCQGDIIYTSNTSIFDWHDGRAAVDVVFSNTDRSPIPDCPDDKREVYHLHNDRDARPGVRVTTCSERGSAGPIKARGKSKDKGRKVTEMGVGACLPTLFGEVRPHLWSWLAGWMDLHHGIGVDHFWVYTDGIVPTEPLKTHAPHTFLDVSWVGGIRKRPRGPGLWYYGQYWTINDCLYRNKALGTKWLLYTDLDEIYTSAQLPTLPSLAAHFATADANPPVDSIFMGNYRVRSKACPTDAALSNPHEWTADQEVRRLRCFVDRDELPECRETNNGRRRLAKQRNPYLCGTWRGRRKHLDRVSAVALTKVHKTLACHDASAPNLLGNRACREVDVDARVAWLDHIQGAPYNTTQQCRCQPL